MVKQSGNLLVVDDNKAVLEAVRLLLRPFFTEVVTLNSPVTLPEQLRAKAWRVVLLDMNFKAGINSGGEGLYWLHRIKEICPELPVVLFTAYADIDLAVRGIKEGAADFVVKPYENQKLVDTLLAAAEAKSAGKTVALKPSSRSTHTMYWGESPAMQSLRQLVEKVAKTEANVLITGENGTGKELLARAIHAGSTHSDKALVTVDMGALTESLFESELFGHVKGAFTDAHADRTGKFVAANGSTLFLDEIGNLPYHLQAKLLTALQSRSVTPVGGNHPIPIQVRLITATNRDLQKMVAEGSFREDLLYRINTIHLHLPALRERKEDIVPLALRFMAHFSEHYEKPLPRLSEAAARRLQELPWAGNIRELEHVIEKAIILNEADELTEEFLPVPASIAPASTLHEEQTITLEAMEIQLIRRTIRQCEGNLSAVAAQLGITRQTLYNKMKRYGL